KHSILVYIHSISDVGQHTELTRITFKHHLSQVLRSRGDISRIAPRPQPGKDLPQAWKNIQVSGRPNVPFVGWKAKHQKGETHVSRRSDAQTIPPSEPLGDHPGTLD